jgi:hypothetical protein
MPWTQTGNIMGPPGVAGSSGPQGSQGPPGIGFTWRGVWSSSTAYAINDAVSRNNQSYVCITAGTGFDPATDTTHWALMASSAIAFSTTTINIPAVGSTMTVVWDQINWMMTSLPVAVGDASSGAILGSFTITSITPATKTVVMQRIS